MHWMFMLCLLGKKLLVLPNVRKEKLCYQNAFRHLFHLFLYIIPLWYQKYCPRKVLVFYTQPSTHMVSLRQYLKQPKSTPTFFVAYHQIDVWPLDPTGYTLTLVTKKTQYWWKYLLPSSSRQGNGTVHFWEQNISDSSITTRPLLCILCGES